MLYNAERSTLVLIVSTCIKLFRASSVKRKAKNQRSGTSV
jgi:hypothetical protein